MHLGITNDRVTNDPENETHITRPLHVELDGNDYVLRYHESVISTDRMVITLPGLTDDSVTVVEGVEASQLEMPVDFISFKYQYPFSLEIYERILQEVVRMTGSKKVLITSSCLGGAVLGHFLNEYASGKYSDEFELCAVIFMMSSIDRYSFNGRWMRVLYGLSIDNRFRKRLLDLMVPVAAQIFPNAEISGQIKAGTVNIELVNQQLYSVPNRVKINGPAGVQMWYVGLDNDPVIENAYNISNLGVAPEHVYILPSSETGSGHHPKNEAEMYALVARLIIKGFDGT